MSDRRCLVAVVHNLPMVYQATAQSLMELGWGDRVETAKTTHGFSEISFAWYQGSPRVDALRERRRPMRSEKASRICCFSTPIWCGPPTC
jgi:hypothetical protein